MAIKIWTIQIAQWRIADKLGIPLLDTTYKSGDPVFAPPKQLVLDIKGGLISEEYYEAVYLQHMRNSWMANQERWDEVMMMPEVALACYCGPDKFCHRHPLSQMLQKACRNRGIDEQLMGEIRKGYVRTPD
jgi:hypothetical protein